MRVTIATRSLFHAWKAVFQEAGTGSFASSPHAHVFCDNRDGQFQAPGKQRDECPLDCHLRKRLLKK